MVDLRISVRRLCKPKKRKTSRKGAGQSKKSYETKSLFGLCAYWSAFDTYYFCVGCIFVRLVVILDCFHHLCVYRVWQEDHFGHNTAAGRIRINAVRGKPVVSGTVRSHNIIACLAAGKFILFYVSWDIVLSLSYLGLRGTSRPLGATGLFNMRCGMMRVLMRFGCAIVGAI